MTIEFAGFFGLPVACTPLATPARRKESRRKSSVDLSAGVSHAMGLVQHLAPLVVLAGHGSQSADNAHAAALNCEAKTGQQAGTQDNMPSKSVP